MEIISLYFSSIILFQLEQHVFGLECIYYSIYGKKTTYCPNDRSCCPNAQTIDEACCLNYTTTTSPSITFNNFASISTTSTDSSWWIVVAIVVGGISCCIIFIGSCVAIVCFCRRNTNRGSNARFSRGQTNSPYPAISSNSLPTYRQQRQINEDKPPTYQELFNNKQTVSNTEAQTNAQTNTQTNTETTTQSTDNEPNSTETTATLPPV